MKPWLSVVGLGEAGLDSLSKAARGLIDDAEVLIGHERHLAMVPDDGRKRVPWPKPLKTAVPEIAKWRGTRVCVLSTGDPSWFGVARTLLRSIPIEETTIVPSPSAFSLACARLGWTLADVDTLSLHAYPVESLHPFVLPGRRLVMLAWDGTTPGKVASLLTGRGYGDSKITVLAAMGGPKEQRFDGTAARWDHEDMPDFVTIAVECVAGPDAPLLPRVPGLPDEAFRHDGQMTKRELRAATLAALAPVPGQRLWDVGAGCGSVAIEWLRSARYGWAIAIERDAGRRALIAENANALGAPDLEIVAGEAPAALEGLEPPDAVFVGGGLSAPGLLDICWKALRPSGRLVANAVTLEGEQALAAWRERHGGALSRIAVSRAAPVGRFTTWQPLKPVTQLAAVKR